jgi:hypothetical protein
VNVSLLLRLMDDGFVQGQVFLLSLKINFIKKSGLFCFLDYRISAYAQYAFLIHLQMGRIN